MSRWFALGSLLAAFGFLLGSATAQDDSKKKDPEAIFKKLDTDKNGRLSKSEFLKLADLGKDKEKARAFLTKVYEKMDPKMEGLTLDQLRKFLDLRKKKKDKG